MDVDALLARHTLSSRQLYEEGLGNLGGVFCVHRLLRADGTATGWLVKRLRSALSAEPDVAFTRYQREHRIVASAFQRTPGARQCMVPESHFRLLNRSLGPSPDITPGREHVVVQRFVCGITLDQAVSRFGPVFPQWIIGALREFIVAYRWMQTERQAIPDVFSLSSDHLKVVPEQKRLYLIDTNNLVTVLQGVQSNALFGRYCSARNDQVTVDDVHRVLDAVVRDFQFDPRLIYSPNKTLDPRQARALVDLSRYFPRDNRDNKYICALRRAFGL